MGAVVLWSSTPSTLANLPELRPSSTEICPLRILAQATANFGVGLGQFDGHTTMPSHICHVAAPRCRRGAIRGQGVPLYFGPIPRRFISTRSRGINFFRFFRFSLIFTLWTLQTAVTRSFMVRFEKFLHFLNRHDVASRGEASDTRLRSRRVCRCLYTTPSIVEIRLYHIAGPRPTRSYVDNSVIYEDFSTPFQPGMHADTSYRPPKLQLFEVMGWGKNGGSKKKISKKKFFPATFLPLSQHCIVDNWSLKRQLKHGGPISCRFSVMGGQKFSPK
jgi:hypothetical protein